MGAKAGILEEEEEEEEENETIKENETNSALSSPNSSPIKNLSNSNSEANIAPEENKEKEEAQTENTSTELPKKSELSDYFAGKTTKTNLNFVRNIEKLQSMQEKAYSSLLERIGNSLVTSGEMIEKPHKISQTITLSSHESKNKFQDLRHKVMSLSVPLF